jgi:ubiquinone/menaquinone biosynthesis C-methylase UbiE
MLERRQNIKAKVAQKASGEESMSLTRQEASAYYFKQWQDMPGNVEEWQNNKSERNHPGRTLAATFIPSKTSLLEVACGIGVDYPLYQSKDVAYFGVDITPKFILEAQRRGVPCEVGDALHLHFKDYSFDNVYSKDLLLHLPPGDWKQALSEMARVTRNQILILDHSWEPQTRYLLAEQYHSPNGRELVFFNNVYKTDEVKAYMDTLGFDMATYQTGSASIGSICVQMNILTVFTRRKQV